MSIVYSDLKTFTSPIVIRDKEQVRSKGLNGNMCQKFFQVVNVLSCMQPAIDKFPEHCPDDPPYKAIGPFVLILS